MVGRFSDGSDVSDNLQAFGSLDMGFSLNFEVLLSFLNQSTGEVVTQSLALGGWVFLAYAFLWAMVTCWKDYKEKKYTKDWKWILLAIDVPVLNIQTPKAVEQLFSQIYSVFDGPSFHSVFRRGFEQNSFSLEIISLEGYIQFLIRCRDVYRDLLEAAIYAQYPDAELTEVEDYVTSIPTRFPNSEYDIWAADFGLVEDFSQPLRLYREFEHSIAEDTILKDPMGTFLESFSRIGSGEQMWFQILMEPIADKEWKEHCLEKIKGLVGEKKESKRGLVDKLADVPIKILELIGDQVFSREASPASAPEKKEGPKNEIQFLTPGQKKLVEAMEEKISKIGFKTKIRAIYLAKKEVFNPTHGVNSLIGAIMQYNNPFSNSLVPKSATSAYYLFADYRKNLKKTLLMSAYKSRDIKKGGASFVLNIEELATIWHFPLSFVKTPLVQKSKTKQTEPPPGLPVGFGVDVMDEEEIKGKEKEEEDKARPSYKTDSGDVVYVDDDYKFG